MTGIASHETILLDAGVSVHVVADRCGHDPAVLLRNYAKRTNKADTAAADVIGTLSASILGQKLTLGRTWVEAVFRSDSVLIDQVIVTS